MKIHPCRKTKPDWSKSVWTLLSNLDNVQTLHVAVKGPWHNQQESRSSEWDWTKHCTSTWYQRVNDPALQVMFLSTITFSLAGVAQMALNHAGTAKGSWAWYPYFCSWQAVGIQRVRAFDPQIQQQGSNHPQPNLFFQKSTLYQEETSKHFPSSSLPRR